MNRAPHPTHRVVYGNSSNLAVKQSLEEIFDEFTDVVTGELRIQYPDQLDT